MNAIKRMTLINLGKIRYERAFEVQKKLRQECLSSDHNFLLVLEHTPVYTLGVRERNNEELGSELVELGADIVHTDRGGLTTFHGPGQLVAYPILNLKHFNLGIRKYVDKLQICAAHTCRLFGISVYTDDTSLAHTGIWANGNKICAIGVHCKRHIVTHGLALNCNVDLSWFDHIVPCGILDKGVTSLTEETSSEITFADALPAFTSSFESTFRCNLEQHAVEEYQI